MYGACIYDAAEILSRTNQPTDKAILGVGLYPYQFIASNLSFQNVVDSFSPLLEFNSMATTWCLHEHHLAEASPPFEARSALFLEIWGLRRLVA